ncbi:hypothetical protein [Streptomyces sp. NPDC094458]|uniref:hypothetical protein n=1 Tax=Streptomyces sp. NPDC094458 TaxID=3155208 RepID=UPI003330678E
MGAGRESSLLPEQQRQVGLGLTPCSHSNTRRATLAADELAVLAALGLQWAD